MPYGATHPPYQGGFATNPTATSAPMPNRPVFVPIMSYESGPASTPVVDSNWRMDVRFRLNAQHGVPMTHISGRAITVLQLQCRAGATNYLDPTEQTIRARSMGRRWKLLIDRFGRTDAERSISGLNAFTDFERESQVNYNDFWARFAMCVTWPTFR